MSRVPFLDDYGDALETATRRSATMPSRQRGWAVATAAFTAVILIGAFWWAMAPRSEPVAIEPVTTTTTLTSTPVASGQLPTVWGRVPPQTALSGQGRLTLSGIAWDGDRFLAVGTDSLGDDLSGVVLASSDGVEWVEAARVPDVSLHDIAVGDDRLVAVGTRGFMPIALWSSDGIGWEPSMLPLPPGPVDRLGQADTVAARGAGFVAGGSVQGPGADEGQAAVLWHSEDAMAWTADADAPFASAIEATVNDIVVAGDTVVAVGLVSVEEGTSRPYIWRLEPGAGWEEFELPVGDDTSGFAGVSGIDQGPSGWVAVGFVPGTTGRIGAVWVSSDGRAWQLLGDPGDLLAGSAPATSTHIHDIATSGGGYVAVGSTWEPPLGRYVMWTSPNGSDWRRFDLEDPDGGLPASSAHAVAANPALVVVAGAAFDISGDLAQGAVWLGPPPPEITASVPIVPDTPIATEQVAVLGVDPDRAVRATQLLIRGRLPEGASDGDSVVVWLHSPSAPPVELCRARRQGRNFECRARLADLGSPPAPGAVFLSLEPASPSPEEGATLEIMPEGSTVVVLSAVYQSNWWPLLQSLHVRNKGADPVDLGGWRLENAVGGARTFEFPPGTVVAPGESVTVAFGSTFGATCPDNSARFFNWCRVVGDGDTVNYTDEQAFWKGGEVYLVDAGGEIHDTWDAPR